jgi:glycosyltransferase involved in cell wall biosynthesis
MNMNISIVICSRDRCEKLAATLESIEASSVQGKAKVQIVVVDNGSRDATAERCSAFGHRSKNDFVYLYEGRKGKSWALNRGVAASHGEIVAFTDDDCIVDSKWIHSILDQFISDCELAVLGGSVRLFDDRDRPISVTTLEERTVLWSKEPEARSMGTATDLIIGRGHRSAIIFGANMAARKHSLDEAGEFDVLLGPGTETVSEDVDFIYRAFQRGMKIVYDPSVVVFHNHGRQTDVQETATLRRYCKGRGALYWKHILAGDRNILRTAADDVYGTTKTILKGLVVGKRFPHHRMLLPSIFLDALRYCGASLVARKRGVPGRAYRLRLWGR